MLTLTHRDSTPPDTLEGVTDKEFLWFKAGHDVAAALGVLGHEVEKLGVEDEIAPLRTRIESFRPHIVFNLLEGFHGLPYYDQHIVSYLELKRVPYTGCNPRGLILSRDKALSKKILNYHRIPTPQFAVFPRGRKVNKRRRFLFPLIVKSLSDDASTGISQASIVSSVEKLEERVQFIHESLKRDAIAEGYVDGREIYVGVMGNHVLSTLPPLELRMDKLPSTTARIATEKVKWDLDYQEKHGIDTAPARDLSEELGQRLARVSKRCYRLLGLSGYARLDYRIDEDGRPYFLEANANPDISLDEEFATAAKAAGLEYETLIQKLLNLGLRRARSL